MINRHVNLSGPLHDAVDRRSIVFDASGGFSTTAYYANGAVQSFTDPEGNTTTYLRDLLDRVTHEVNELGHARVSEYDPNGNRTAAVDRNGRRREFAFDALDRQTDETWFDDNMNPVWNIHSEYNAASEMTSIVDPASAYHYEYDLAGRVVSVSNAGTPGSPLVELIPEWNAANERVGLDVWIDGVLDFTNAYAYHATGLLAVVTQGGAAAASKRVELEYTATHQLDTVERYADLVGSPGALVAESDYDYDALDRLTDLSHFRGATVIAPYTWGYDDAGRINANTNKHESSSFQHDATGQLTDATHSAQDNEDYDYDLNGNRVNPGYVTADNNLTISDGVYTYQYDHEGNRTVRDRLDGTETTWYEWDHRNRLVRVVVNENEQGIERIVDYTYDAYNQRIAKVVDGVETRYAYDQGNVVADFNANGLAHRYLHGNAIDQVFADERIVVDGVPGQTRWALTDNIGSVRDIIDDAGTLLHEILYTSFGAIRKGVTSRPLVGKRLNSLELWRSGGVVEGASRG